MHTVYLLQSERFPSKRYIGITTDIKQRIVEHNQRNLGQRVQREAAPSNGRVDSPSPAPSAPVDQQHSSWRCMHRQGALECRPDAHLETVVSMP